MKTLIVTFVWALSFVTLCATYTPAGDVDPTGTWNVVRSASRRTGPCPAGSAGKGELTISRVDGVLTLTYGKGMTCRPAAVCKLAGSLSKGVYTFVTTVPVDDEGGKVTNFAEIKFASGKAGSGKGSSRYVHPSGMTCTWTFDLALSR
jgi:hypothetical protein